MDEKFIENNIDACLTTMSETLYNFQDEIVNMHNMIGCIRTYRDIGEKLKQTKGQQDLI